MSETVTVELGDSITSIAHEHGHTVKKVWEHPNNAALKAKRKDPNILMVGDEVFVPDIEIKEETCATNQKHKFKLTAETITFRMQLFLLGEPRGNEAYVLIIDGKKYEGTTSGDGRLEQTVPADAKGGVLQLKGGKETYPVRIGHLNPIDEISGVQQRLNNLGLRAGAEDGEMNDDLRAALIAFQAKYKLPATGEIDGATKAKLAEVCP